MASQHTVSAYDEELQFLTHKIAEMGGHAERMVEQSVAAIVNADNALAQRVISDDLILDASEREIDDKAVMIIAKRQPMAVDLREIIGSIRISADLERVGDLGKISRSALLRFQSRASRASFIAVLKLSLNWH